MSASQAEHEGSIPFTCSKMNDPTQSGQIVVSCLDWVGLLFVCNSCVSRGIAFFNFGCHVSLTKNKQYKIKVQNVQLGGFEPLLTLPDQTSETVI